MIGRGDQSKIKNPIFWQDTEGYLYKVDSVQAVEVNDVEEIKKAWDSGGRVLEFYLNAAKRVNGRIKSNTPQIEEFKKEIREYAERHGFIAKFDDSETDMAKIYSSIAAERETIFKKLFKRR